jgi:thioredoxin reductase (NADPH)
MYDIIIVGAGPAGMTAAIYALRANKKILVFEAKAYGGQIASSSVVENYPGYEKISGFDLATNMYNQAVKLGAEFKFEMVKKITKDREVITDKGTYKAKTIILATGSENRRLNIPGEVEYIGKGVSYCASCDGNFFKGKDVAVIGGGNTALEDTNYLSGICNKVYLIHRNESFRGDEALVDQVELDKNVEIIMNSNIVGISGDDVLNKITIKDKEENTRDIDISGLFVAIGQQPKNELFADIIELDEKGYIKTEDGVHTNQPFIYVAGDTRAKDLRQLTTAVSDGSIAATVAIKEMEA